MVLSGDKHTRRDWLHSRAAEIVDLVFAEDIRIATESSHCSEIVTHELKKHNLVVNEAVESSSDTSKEHYVFNYHNAKLGMSLLLTNIQDVTKEGDGERVMALSTPVRFISGPGQSVICPYNDAHIVKSNRLLRHILNCRKNYTGPDLAVCQYSAVHIMRPAEIQQHEATCPYEKRKKELGWRLYPQTLKVKDMLTKSKFSNNILPSDLTDTVYEKYRISLSAQMNQPIQKSTFLTMLRESTFYNLHCTIKSTVYRRERQVYVGNARVSFDDPTAVLSIIIDGMNQNKTAIPHFAQKTRMGTTKIEPSKSDLNNPNTSNSDLNEPNTSLDEHKQMILPLHLPNSLTGHKHHLHPMTVSKLHQPPLSLKLSPRSLGFREAGQL
ncbi:hypothetical protein Bbelb_291290 [Branchiostoma belcheri]|nr:hypothetical protein Bbelb_291290 [Branchiostoma belcheri]